MFANYFENRYGIKMSGRVARLLRRLQIIIDFKLLWRKRMLVVIILSKVEVAVSRKCEED